MATHLPNLNLFRHFGSPDRRAILLVAPPDEQAEVDKRVPLSQDTEELVEHPVPYPATAQGPLAQPDAEVDVVKPLQGLAADEVGHAQEPAPAVWHGSHARRQPVDDEPLSPEDGHALVRDAPAEEQDGRRLQVCPVPPLTPWLCRGLPVVAPVQVCAVRPVQRAVVDYVAYLGREVEEGESPRFAGCPGRALEQSGAIPACVSAQPLGLGRRGAEHCA